MTNDNHLLIQPEAPDAIGLECPILFTGSIVLVNHSGKHVKMGFGLPPGLYPNPEYLEKLLKETIREAIKALKMQTTDLSWRLPTPQEFVNITSGGTAIKAKKKWQEPYSVKLEFEEEHNVVTDDNNSSK
jgi:hypothetical protein